MDLPKLLLDSALLVKANAIPFCINTAPIPTLQASLSIKKVLNKLGIANNVVEHITSLSLWKATLAYGD